MGHGYPKYNQPLDREMHSAGPTHNWTPPPPNTHTQKKKNMEKMGVGEGMGYRVSLAPLLQDLAGGQLVDVAGLLHGCTLGC